MGKRVRVLESDRRDKDKYIFSHHPFSRINFNRFIFYAYFILFQSERDEVFYREGEILFIAFDFAPLIRSRSNRLPSEDCFYNIFISHLNLFFDFAQGILEYEEQLSGCVRRRYVLHDETR